MPASPGFTPTAINDPADWTAATLPPFEQLASQVSPQQAQELIDLCTGLERQGRQWDSTGRADFPFVALAPLLEQARRQLAQGRGFTLFRGLPFDRLQGNALQLAAWGLGTWLGDHVSQTVTGLRMVDVMDVTGKEASPRQYRTSQELRLHTDPASDLIGLACVQDAMSGGDSVVTSAVAVHNAMLSLRPDLLALLYRGFYWHRFGEQRPQDAPFTSERLGVFSVCDGRLSCRYVRSPIAAGHKEAGVPLTDDEIAALDLFDRLAASPGLRLLSFRMAPGDLLMVNNLAVLHARSQFQDHDDPAKRRRMIRLWLQGPAGFRPMDPALNYFNGGQCGIAPQAGQQANYDVATLYRERASGGVFKLGL